MMRNKTNFIKLIQIWGIIFLIGIGLTFVIIDVIRAYSDFHSRADQIRSDFIAGQKLLVKQEVDQAVDMIHYEKDQSESLTRKKIKSRVNEAYSIVQNIYQQNQHTESKIKIQHMILDALRPIRFENGSGYYFITQLDGFEVLFADRPQMEGSNLLNMQDSRGQYVVKDMIKVAKESGEGFYEYYWTKPASAGNDFKKISFIKLFEPYGWIIGTGLYVNDIESQIKTDLLSTISRIRFGKEGYIFVNNFNGDALVSNGKVFSETKKLWEVFNDNPEKTKNIFEKEYQAALKPEGDYIYYSWVKLTTSDQESLKTSYIFGIPDLQWIVGAGVYLDEVETDIALMQTNMNNQIKVKIFYFCLGVIGIIGFFFLFFNWLNHRLKSDISLFISFFKGAANFDQEIDREQIKFIELDEMAEYANKMLSDRKQAEEKLRESEARYRLDFENISDIVYTIDSEFRVLNISPSVEWVLGYQPKELIGRPFQDLNLLEPKYIEQAFSDAMRVFNGERITSSVYQFIARDGSKKWGEVSGAPLFRDNQIFALVSVARDITERVRYNEENAKLESRLQQAQKMEAIGSLAGGIAHDLNNILFPISGLSEMLLDEMQPDNPARENIEQIHKSAQRGSDLVKQVLAFSRQSNLQKLPIRLQPILKEVLTLVRSTIPANIEITSHLEPDCGMVSADPTKIHQIAMNLITNAYHAVEETGGTIDIALKEAQLVQDHLHDISMPEDFLAGSYACITISDTGTGIDQHLINKIFDPYFSTKELGKGTGLGLSVVHGIVKEHGGDIRVYSEKGKGTVFHVYLPLVKDAKDDKTASKSRKIHQRGCESILLVDDEKAIVRLEQMMLEGLGYQITVRTSSLDALGAFKANPSKFDLVISDRGMPNMTGEQLAKEIISIRPEIPIILCTGFSDENDERRAKAMGIKGFLKKPVTISDIAETVRKVLDEVKS